MPGPSSATFPGALLVGSRLGQVLSWHIGSASEGLARCATASWHLLKLEHYVWIGLELTVSGLCVPGFPFCKTSSLPSLSAVPWAGLLGPCPSCLSVSPRAPSYFPARSPVSPASGADVQPVFLCVPSLPALFSAAPPEWTCKVLGTVGGTDQSSFLPHL